MNKSIALLLPVLNEIDGLKKILPGILQDMFDEILIIDGGSSDGSYEFAISTGLKVIKQNKSGLSAAILEGINHVSSDCVVEFSLDGNCKVSDLPQMVAKLKEGYELVVASRYLPPAKSLDDTIITAFGNFMFTKIIRWLGRFPITDSLTIYRGFNKKIVDLPEFKKILYGPVFEPLVSVMAQVYNLSIYEFASEEPKRIGGSSKMRIIYNGSCILLMFFRVLFRRIFLFKRYKKIDVLT